MGSFAEPYGSPRGKVQIADPVPSLGPNVRITPQARYYAIGELCRRAGITREFFRTWKVSSNFRENSLRNLQRHSEIHHFPTRQPPIF